MKETGDKGEQIVIKDFKKKGINAHKAKFKAGYDVKAGEKIIEIKSTRQSIKQKSFFLLTQNEFLTACREKDYWIYWVDVNKEEIILKINRDEILANIKPEH